MTICDLKQIIEVNQHSTFPLDKTNNIQAYYGGGTGNFIEHDDVLAQVIFREDHAEIYERHDGIIRYHTPTLTCAFDDDISALQSILPFNYLVQLVIYHNKLLKRRRILEQFPFLRRLP